MGERKTGAGIHLSGVLERSTPPKQPARPEPPAEADESDPSAVGVEATEAETEPQTIGRGRGGARAESPRRARPAAEKVQRKTRGRTVYLPDDLFERIIVQAHRRDKTISEYVTMILDRQVPDHRTVRADPADDAA